MALTINRNGHYVQINPHDAGAVGSVFPLIRDDESWSEVEIELTRDEEKSASALPLMATASDVREIVKFLRKRPGGVTVVEAVEAIKKPTLDPRKMTAYEYWGLVTRQGDRIRLSARGWEFARKLEPETQAFRDLLGDTEMYHAALVWLHETQAELVTDADLAEHWRRRHAAAVGDGSEKTVKANVACFFHLCQAAEFGSLTIGKRGQPTRLRVDQGELESYLSAGPAAGAFGQSQPEAYGVAQSPPRSASEPLSFRASAPGERAGRLRVFISAAGGGRAAAQLRDALELAEIEGELHERGDDGAALVSEKVVEVMRGCDAAVVIVADDDCRETAAGAVTLAQDVLNQINAAFALYDRQVALVWAGDAPLPGGLESLTRFEVAGGGLTLERGVQIVRAVKAFRRLRHDAAGKTD
jgi:hypothetical protein